MSRNYSEDRKITSSLLLGRLFGFLKPYYGLLLLSLILNFLFSALTAVSISLIRPILQVIFSTQSTPVEETGSGFLDGIKNGLYSTIQIIVYSSDGKEATLINLGILVIVIFVLKNVVKYYSSIVSTWLGEGMIKEIRDKVFSKLTSLSVDFFSRSSEGTLISVITNDVAALHNSTISSFTTFVRELIQLIIFLLLLLAISVKLTLIAFGTSAVSLVLIRYGTKYIRRYSSRMQTAMADYTTTLQETISGIKVVKAYNAENISNLRFFDDTNKYVRSAIKHQKITTLIPSISEIFAVLALSVVLFIGGVEVIQGKMSGDELFTFLFFLFSIMTPITLLIHSVALYQRGYVAAERVFKIIDQKPTIESGKNIICELNNSITVRNVSFSYRNEPVIINANFEVKKGKKIAFVGPSGSGKSTMLDLIIRFYDPVEGEILVDNENIKNFSIESYRSLIGIVAQESMLFNDSVANNIKFGYPCATMEQIIEASRLANAYDFIMKLPRGFDSKLGDRGVLLSGGERQRISIARALVRNPQILVFDEATSSLDAESEKVVQDAINLSLQNRTAIIVAHRLSTIINCDEILVFDNGRIVERGNHSELIRFDGIYKRLYDIQFKELQ